MQQTKAETPALAHEYHRCTNERCGWQGPEFDLYQLGSVGGPVRPRSVCPRCKYTVDAIDADLTGNAYVTVDGIEFTGDGEFGLGGCESFMLHDAHVVDADGETFHDLLSEASGADLHRLLAWIPPERLSRWVMGQVEKRGMVGDIESRAIEGGGRRI